MVQTSVAFYQTAPEPQVNSLQQWVGLHMPSPTPIYDADLGEYYLKFGEHSRIVVPSWSAGEPLIPSERCSCGIYATSDIEEARQYGTILGRVALWGRIVVHQKGWRAQYAYPTALYRVPDNLREALCKYAVPMLRAEDIRTGRSSEALADRDIAFWKRLVGSKT